MILLPKVTLLNGCSFAWSVPLTKCNRANRDGVWDAPDLLGELQQTPKHVEDALRRHCEEGYRKRVGGDERVNHTTSKHLTPLSVGCRINLLQLWGPPASEFISLGYCRQGFVVRIVWTCPSFSGSTKTVSPCCRWRKYALDVEQQHPSVVVKFLHLWTLNGVRS